MIQFINHYPSAKILKKSDFQILGKLPPCPFLSFKPIGSKEGGQKIDIKYDFRNCQQITSHSVSLIMYSKTWKLKHS